MLRIAVLRFGGHGTKNGHDPQEAVDWAFEQFERKGFDTLSDEERPKVLRTIVTRRAIDLVKYDKPTDALPEHDHLSRLGDEDSEFERVEDRDEARAELRRLAGVLSRLKPRQRDVLHRKFVEKQSTTEIADALHITPRRVLQIVDEAVGRAKRKVDATTSDRDEPSQADQKGKEGGT
jgi:RNA polymerase sigma factor (sigma-70 family)